MKMNFQTKKKRSLLPRISPTSICHVVAGSAPKFPSKSPKGSAIILALVLMTVAAMLIVMGTRLLVVESKQTQQQTLAVAEAENAARAGLVDAINWYRRQNGYVAYYAQPVVSTPTPNPGCAGCQYIDDAFAPTQNASTQDTMDASVGIVQQYPINGATIRLSNTNNIWARYEIRKQPNPAFTPPPAPTPTVDPRTTVHDITGEKITTALDGEGWIWSLFSTGYIFINNDSTKAYNQYPNKVLASAQMSTEIRKLALNIPANAAAMTPNMRNIVVKNNGILNGLSGGTTYFACAAYSNAASGPVTTGGGKISPSTSAIDTSAVPAVLGINASSPISIFGVNEAELKGLADFTGDSLTSYKPLSITGSDKLSYFEGNLTYDPASTMPCYQSSFLNNVGTGVIYVKGNFTLKPATGGQIGAFFSGVVYANGAVTIGEGNEILGCVMSTTGITVSTGTVGDKANLAFSLPVILREQQLVGVYRENKAAIHNFIAAPNL